MPGIPGDAGLVLKTKAAHHAISAPFDEVFDPKGKTLIVSYEVKLQKGLDCGGAYIKLLTDSDEVRHEFCLLSPCFLVTDGVIHTCRASTPRSSVTRRRSTLRFRSSTPSQPTDTLPFLTRFSTLMFGPDRCGSTSKVHLIVRHRNPLSGEVEEKHLAAPPSPKLSKTTALYTLLIRPDQTYEIRINDEKVKSGSLLEDFAPPFNPPKEVDDPTDSKPEDWVETPKIPDPDAVKPADWDEDAPASIPDPDAEKPEDWLEDEPTTVPDPEAQKPEEWDDEDDGDWIAPMVPNPRCEGVSGCGPWKRPEIPNRASRSIRFRPCVLSSREGTDWFFGLTMQPSTRASGSRR